VLTGALMAWGPPQWRAIAIGPYRLMPLVHELTGVLSVVAALWAALPRQAQTWRPGRFNLGQRLNALFTIGSVVVLGATGVLIWLGRTVPYWVQEPAYELHVLTALLAFVVFLGHLAMAVTHPRALRAIVTGRG
jgi:cytochrome b subunit of formate dehydrogenase